MAQHKKNKIVDKWKENPDTATVIGGLSATIRHFLLREVNYKCQSCEFEGYNPVTGNSILEVDHIDGNCNNNAAENLRVICPNCHAMSPNYKALNKDSGRKYRARYG
jgi:Zn finger protein HypA/HybF involved in hydrogenase expression